MLVKDYNVLLLLLINLQTNFKMKVLINSTLVCIVIVLQVVVDARVGRNKTKTLQNDSPRQNDYEEYDEYDYDYDNGTEIGNY